MVGDVTELRIAAALVASGRTVLRPLSAAAPYDLALADGVQITRVQCKTGKMVNGVIEFRTYTVKRLLGNVGYDGHADAFGVYCPDNDTCYLVPIGHASRGICSLRVNPVRNGQKKKIRNANDYLIKCGRSSIG